MALFGSTATAATTTKNLVEFRCGKMRMKGRMVSADKRKGMFYIYQSDDSLIHLCWKDREKGKVEDDLIIFPDDCEWKKVPQCTTGRVFVLKFNSSSRRMFFWMQEPKEDKDEELAKKVNDAINNPPKPGRGGTSSGLSDLTDALGQGNLQDLFNNVDHQQLLQIMAAGGGLGNLLTPVRSNRSQARSTTSKPSQAAVNNSASTTSSSTSSGGSMVTTADPSAAKASFSSTTTSSSDSGGSGNNNSTAPGGSAGPQGVKLSQLQDILSQIQKPPTPIDLSEAITPEAMIPILSDPKVQDRLRPHLPQGSEAFSSNADELRATARSPHFRQAMASFSSALASGQLGPLLAQFGLPKAAQEAANKGDVEEFAKAMQQASKEEKKEGAANDEDEKMNVD